MDAAVLVRITPSGPGHFPCLRRLLGAARRLRTSPGFIGFRTFRGLEARDELFVLVEWEDAASLSAALEQLGIGRLRTEAAALGFELGPLERLTGSFERSWPGTAGTATLLRYSRSPRPARGAAARDSGFALHALAAPGTTRVWGARTPEGDAAVCLIDFAAEDGIWGFLESPIRQKWSQRARLAREEEGWALNLPRLSFGAPAAGPRRRAPLAAEGGDPPVQLTLGERGESARLRFLGKVEPRTAERCARVCEALIEDGCRHLEVDLTGMETVSDAAVRMLVRTARLLKERGGQFVLVDDAERVKRITRAKHLEASIR